MTQTSLRDKKPRFFYGWYIVLASFLAHIAYAEQNSSILGVFLRPMTREFGWSRTELTGAQSVARLVEGIFAPVIGPIIDRHGPRPLMLVGSLIAGLGFLALSQINTIWQFYLTKGLVIAIGFLCMGFMVTNTAISNWFVRLRGRAIGIAGMGTSLANVAMAPVVVWMIGQWDWRSAWMAFGLLTWIVVLVPSALLMRRRPEDEGLRPDGDEPYQTSAEMTTETHTQTSVESEPLEPIWGRSEVVRTSAFWLIILTFSVSNLAFQGINISMVPYFEDLGFATSIAAAALVTRAIIQLIAAPLWGFAVERIDVRYLGFLKFSLQGLAALLFLIGRNIPVLFTGVIVYAIGSSGSAVISEIIWANFFGRLTLGSIRGVGTPLLTLFSAIGPVFMNIIFDLTGSYELAFILFIFLFALSAGLILLLKQPQATRFARASEFGASHGASHSD